MRLLTLLVGESGCGKSTLTDKLVAMGRGFFHKVLSTVSRPEREGEESGQDYYFTSRKVIEAHQDRGELVQLTEFNGNYYCTREQDYFSKKSPISVLSVVPEHVMTVFNYFRQPHYANDIMFQILYFNSTDELLKRHLGDGWEERVKRGNIRKRFMELYPHIRQHIPVEMIEDRMIDEMLHILIRDFLMARLRSVNSSYLIDGEGSIEFKDYPRITDFEGSMAGINSIVQLEGLQQAVMHSPHLGNGKDWTKFAIKTVKDEEDE